MVVERAGQFVVPPDAGIELFFQKLVLGVLDIEHIWPDGRKTAPHSGELVAQARVNERQPIRSQCGS